MATEDAIMESWRRHLDQRLQPQHLLSSQRNAKPVW